MFMKCLHTIKKSYIYMYHIDIITVIFNTDNFMSPVATCAASSDCVSGEGCGSGAVCSKCTYSLDQYNFFCTEK